MPSRALELGATGACADPPPPPLPSKHPDPQPHNQQPSGYPSGYLSTNLFQDTDSVRPMTPTAPTTPTPDHPDTIHWTADDEAALRLELDLEDDHAHARWETANPGLTDRTVNLRRSQDLRDLAEITRNLQDMVYAAAGTKIVPTDYRRRRPAEPLTVQLNTNVTEAMGAELRAAAVVTNARTTSALIRSICADWLVQYKEDPRRAEQLKHMVKVLPAALPKVVGGTARTHGY